MEICLKKICKNGVGLTKKLHTLVQTTLYVIGINERHEQLLQIIDNKL